MKQNLGPLAEMLVIKAFQNQQERCLTFILCCLVFEEGVSILQIFVETNYVEAINSGPPTGLNSSPSSHHRRAVQLTSPKAQRLTPIDLWEFF